MALELSVVGSWSPASLAWRTDLTSSVACFLSAGPWLCKSTELYQQDLVSRGIRLRVWQVFHAKASLPSLCWHFQPLYFHLVRSIYYLSDWRLGWSVGITPVTSMMAAMWMTTEMPWQVLLRYWVSRMSPSSTVTLMFVLRSVKHKVGHWEVSLRAVHIY